MASSDWLAGFVLAPVQSFIEESRKAQDFWSSSLLLSDIVEAGLNAFETSGAQRISPARVDEKVRDPARPSVTNEGIFLLEKRTAEDAVKLAREAADRVLTRWKGIADEVKRQLLEADLFRENELALWDEQVQVTFNVAWAVEPSDANVAESLRRLRRLLASAKRVRAVHPYLGDGRAKCTLSGDYEFMGPQDDFTGRHFWSKVIPERLKRLTPREGLRWAITARLEGDGRERLCAVSLIRRLAPLLVLRKDRDLGGDPGKDESSPLRFPSTTAIAWMETKRLLVEAAQRDPKSFIRPLEEFVGAVEAYCDASELPQGRHVLPCHESLVENCSGALQTAVSKFLRLDGSWLGENERDQPRGFGREPGEPRTELRALREARTALARLAPQVGIGRTPPLALIRADGDRLGKLSSEMARREHLRGLEKLSEALGSRVMPACIQAIEKDCFGKVIFAGGDEFIAMVPAAWALKAAGTIDRAFYRACDELTCSVAVLLVAPSSPLRAAIGEVTDLLEDAKNHRRPGHPEGRHALGLEIIPGSGNVKRGVIGLRVPERGDPNKQLHAIDDLLMPLSEALARAAPAVSPKLYREWLEEFDFPDAIERADAVDPEIALAEFTRLAQRHVAEHPEKAALTGQLTECLERLLRSGHEKSSLACWTDLRGLLLAVTSLGTREITG